MRRVLVAMRSGATRVTSGVERVITGPNTSGWGPERLALAREAAAGFIALGLAYLTLGITLSFGGFDVSPRVSGLFTGLGFVGTLLGTSWRTNLGASARSLDRRQEGDTEAATAQRQAMVDELRVLNAALAPRSRALRRSARPYF